MATVTEQIEVNVPVRTAYNQWTQFEEFPRFMEGVKAGHAARRHAPALGAPSRRQREGVERRDHRADSRTSGSPGERRRRRERRGGDASTASPTTRLAVMLQLDYDPEGVVENVGDALGCSRARVKGDLERFKEFIESRGVETGAWRGTVDAGSPR